MTNFLMPYREEDIIDAEIIEISSSRPPGAIERGFAATGRFVERVLRYISDNSNRARRWAWRNLRSFWFWLGECRENLALRLRLWKIDRKNRVQESRKPITCPVFFTYLAVGTSDRV